MKPMGTLLVTAGGILAGIGVIWGVVIGYYPSEIPALLGTLGSGLLLLFIGSRMIASTKPTKVEWRPATPTMPAPPAVSAPTNSASAAVEPAAAIAPAVTAQASHGGQPAPADPASVSDIEDQLVDDKTVAVPRRRRTLQWALHLPDGASLVVNNEVVIGRAPQPSREYPDADLVVVDDPSISKSHAMLRLADGGLQVLDLDSANGTVVVVNDVEQPCTAGEWATIPDGAALELGTAELLCSSTVSREATP